MGRLKIHLYCKLFLLRDRNEQEPQVESANVDPLQETTDAQQDQTVNLQKISKSKERLSSESDTELQERRDQAKRDHQKYLED